MKKTIIACLLVLVCAFGFAGPFTGSVSFGYDKVGFGFGAKNVKINFASYDEDGEMREDSSYDKAAFEEEFIGGLFEIEEDEEPIKLEDIFKGLKLSFEGPSVTFKGNYNVQENLDVFADVTYMLPLMINAEVKKINASPIAKFIDLGDDFEGKINGIKIRESRKNLRTILDSFEELETDEETGDLLDIKFSMNSIKAHIGAEGSYQVKSYPFELVGGASVAFEGAFGGFSSHSVEYFGGDLDYDDTTKGSVSITTFGLGLNGGVKYPVTDEVSLRFDVLCDVGAITAFSLRTDVIDNINEVKEGTSRLNVSSFRLNPVFSARIGVTYNF